MEVLGQTASKEIGNTPRVFRRSVSGFVWACCLWASLLFEQTVSSQTNGVAPVQTNAVAIPVAEVAAQLEATSSTLQTISEGSAPDPRLATYSSELPVISREITARLDENSRILARNPSLGNLRRLSREWRELANELAERNRVLTRRASHLESQMQELADLAERWKKTQETANKTALPSELVQQVSRLRSQITRTQDDLQDQHAAVLVVQSRVTEQRARVREALDAIEHARTETLRRLFVKDSPALWEASLWSGEAWGVWQANHRSVARQVAALLAYGERSSGRFVLHSVAFLVLLGSLLWVRRRPGQRPAEDGFQDALLLVQAPTATAFLLSLLLSGWIYPQAPRLLWAIVGALALIPATILLRRLLDAHLMPVLAALIVFYFVDQLRNVTASEALTARGLFLAEALAGVVFSAWLIGSKHLCAVPENRRDLVWRTIRIGARLACLAFGLAFFLNAAGYQSLSKLICNTLLVSSYLAVLFYALFRVIDSLSFVLLSEPPLGSLRFVLRHRSGLRLHLRRAWERAVVLLWVVCLINAVGLSGAAARTLHQVWTAKAAVGSFHATVGDLVLFALTIWAAFFVSNLLRYGLREEVFPRLQLAPGLYYSISQMVHYAVLLAGFLIGIALLGVSLTKLTILAGAFGVGVGFGLQNIVNNFISGIILLFERPVKVGDLIEVAGTEGIVKSIGIRATVVRTISGSEIVIPNGKLISDPLTNWTFSNRQRLITIPIAVAPEAPPRRVIELMQAIATANAHVVKDPPPQALFTGFAGGSLNFELRAWTDRLLEWTDVRSELVLATNSTLASEKISLR